MPFVKAEYHSTVLPTGALVTFRVALPPTQIVTADALGVGGKSLTTTGVVVLAEQPGIWLDDTNSVYTPPAAMDAAVIEPEAELTENPFGPVSSRVLPEPTLPPVRVSV
jgi:hypothetical protein